MRITVKTGLLFAAIWIAFKMMFFMTGLTGDSIQTSAMINILCLLLSISVGLYLVKRGATEETSLMTDIKNGMTSGVPYILVVSIFMYIFYSEINPEFISHLKAEKIQAMKTMLDDPEELARLKSDNADFEVMSKDQIFERMKQGPENTLSAKATSVLNLLALLLLATMNSIFVAVIYRKVVFVPREQ
tara:strand:- start:1256 stop:1819 length:564 start_codon:yes stop_codon:yes gene_type:complete